MKLCRNFALGLLFLGVVVGPVHAYSNRTCQGAPLRLPTNNHTVYYNTSSFPSGDYDTAINNSISQFNNNPSAFYYTALPTASVQLNNGRSEIWGTTDNSLLNNSPAVAFSYWDCYWNFGNLVAQMKEGDIVFDYRNASTSNWLWTPIQTKSVNMSYGGTKRLIQSTAIHELGHAAGLLHEARMYNVMGTDFTHLNTQGSAAQAYIGADTGGGLVSLYGKWSQASEDLGVTHWYRTGANGEYSTHSRTRIIDKRTGRTVSSFVRGREPIYRVSSGQLVKVEFTYENVGRSYQSQRPVSFYLSSNETITTSDFLISSNSRISLPSSGHLTQQFDLRIPYNLVAGAEYWLGVIINPANNAPIESDTGNNASYIRIRVN